MHSLLVGPVVAVLAVFVLMGFLRWSHAPTRVPPTDFGLLVTLLSTPDELHAEVTRAVLADGGVRATVTPAPRSSRVEVDADGRVLAQRPTWLVLVFPADEAVARALLTP